MRRDFAHVGLCTMSLLALLARVAPLFILGGATLSAAAMGPIVVISKGITIGNQCVIGANSFVNKDILEGAKAWGSSARIRTKYGHEK